MANIINDIKKTNLNVDMGRPDPDKLLSLVNSEQMRQGKGKFKIFFGYAAGVGKTYAMLSAAHELKKNGVDVVIGYIEPHTRPDTLALLDGLEILPTLTVRYRGIKLNEFDLDGALIRKPELILVDELAHSNPDGLRHKKRWQDIEELINSGIDVFTTLNVQHIESLNDLIAGITHAMVRETIADFIFDQAEQVELIDIETEELLQRFSEGKIYSAERALWAKNNFFTRSNLDSLREIALRRTADRVNREKELSRMTESGILEASSEEQLLVNVTPSPFNASVIRTAARMADVYYAKWYAVYVENGSRKILSPKRKAQLEANVQLAKQLGAEVVILENDHISKALLEFAKIKNINRIVIGKQKPKSLSKLFLWRRSTADWLVRMAGNIDIHLIRVSGEEEESKQYLGLLAKSLKKIKVTGKDFLKMILIMLFSYLAAEGVRFLGLPEPDVILTFIMAVLLVSLVTSGYVMGITASFITILFYNYFFTEPLYTFNVNHSGDMLTFPFILSVAVITSTLMSRIQEQANASFKKEQRTQLLYEMARGIIRTSSVEEIVQAGIDRFGKLLEMPIAAYMPNENGKIDKYYIDRQSEQLTKKVLMIASEVAVANWVFINGKIAGHGTQTLPGARGYYMPIIGQNGVYGVIGIDCSLRILTEDQSTLIETMMAQIGIAVEREVLVKEKAVTKLEIEMERLKSTLLRAISHDLRTPLTSIAGASSTIIDNGDKMTEEMKLRLLKDIFEDSMWLSRMVENLLSMTKIDEGKLNLSAENQTVDEVISTALYRMKRLTLRHQLEIILPKEVFLVPMDGNLIVQVLINLIDNATKFTPSNGLIKIKSFKQFDRVYFEISDSGRGISEKSLDKIFNSFYSSQYKEGNERRGVGLGLPICRAIVEAHGGEIEAGNLPEGGALIRFWIPSGKELED